MATVISNNQFVDYDEKSKEKFEDIFVEYQSEEGGKRIVVPIKSLYIEDGKKVRQIKSFEEFKKNLKKNKVFTGASKVQTIKHFSQDTKLQVVGVSTPDKYTTIEVSAKDEKVPYGLRRKLKVQEAKDSTLDSDKYFYVKIAGEDKFLQPRAIYFYDNTNKKRTLNEVLDYKDLENVQLYDENGMKIDLLYTEKQYTFETTLSSEQIDFEKLEKITTEKKEIQNEDGTLSYEVDRTKTSTHKIDRYYSEQQYVQKEVADETNPGKTKKITLIEAKNFQMQPDGEYCSVRVDGNVQMVKKDAIVDEDGLPISDLRTMVGKRVSIKQDGTIIATTEPLTFEQAYFNYSTIKTYQETDKNLSENTYLRLKNGEYVKELENVKPISYKLASGDDAKPDAYVVRTKDAEGNKKYVIVPANYFEKLGNKAKYKRDNAVPIQRCAFESDDCVVVQTTSKGEDVEQSAIVKNCKILDEEINVEPQVKEDVMQSTMAGYKDGTYQIKDVYHNGELEEVSARGARYEYSDISYLQDFAGDLNQFKSLKTEAIQIKDGKIVGGPKFSIGKSNKEAFKGLGQFAAYGFGVAAMAGIFIPVVGPFISAGYALGAAGAVPLIPIVNTVRGIVKNHQRSKFIDKAKYNQKANMKDLEKRMKILYERMTNKEFVPFPQARFDDEYSKLVNDIISLSSCTVANKLIVVNGEAKVTPENAAAAREYIKEFNKVKKALKSAKSKTLDAKSKFDKLDEEMKKLEEEGRKIPEKLQKAYDKAKLEYMSTKKHSDELSARHEKLMNYNGNPTELETHTERDHLLQVASMMRTAVYLQSDVFKDHPLVQEALHGEHGLTDTKDIETTIDLASYVITEEDLQLDDEKKSDILNELIASLPEEKQVALTDDDKLQLLQNKIDDMLYEKRAQYTEEEILNMIEERNLTDMVKHDLIINTKDNDTLKRFEEASTIQEKIEIIRENERNKLYNSAQEEPQPEDTKGKKGKKSKAKAKEETMFDRLEMDFKNGLLIDGIGVGLKDEDIMYKAEYPRGYRWEKVKQAVEFVYYGLQGEVVSFEKQDDFTEEPFDAKGEDPAKIEEPFDTKGEPAKDKDAKTETPKKPSKSKEAGLILGEHAVVRILEEKEENDLYKHLYSKLTRKNGAYKLSKDEAEEFLFNFALKINEAHDKNISAQTMFEKGSIEAKILAEAKKETKNLVTQNAENQAEVKEEDIAFTPKTDKVLTELRGDYLSQMKDLESQHLKNEKRINNLYAKQKMNVDILTEIRGAYANLAEKQEALKIVAGQEGEIDDQLKAAKAEMKNAKDPEVKQIIQLRIDALEQEYQKYGDMRADRYESKCKAEGELEKILKKYGYEGKTLKEVIESMEKVKAEISSLSTENKELETLINALEEKYQATFEHSV